MHLNYLFVHALTVPLLPSNAAARTVQLKNLSSPSVQCSSGRSGPSIQPSDCQVAISLFPHDHPDDFGYDNVTRKTLYPVFSPNAMDSRHRMPIYRTRGSCIAAVQMRDFAMTDRSSWSIVSTMAQNVLQECVQDGSGVGGTGTVGEKGMIQVILCSTLCLRISKSCSLISRDLESLVSLRGDSKP